MATVIASESTPNELGASQKEVVVHRGKPLFVSGPPGSGKTQALKARISHLLSAGVPCERILFFTEDEEIAESFRDYLKPGYSEFWIDNFTGFCKRVLRQNYNRVPGLYPNFQVLDGLEERLVLREIIKSIKLKYYREVQRTSGFLDELVEFIDLWKLNPGVNLPNFGKFRDLEEVFRHYQDYLHKANSLDFRDLVLKTIQLFEANPKVLNEYRERFTHIILDDFQNMDLNQYRLFSLLAREKQEVVFSGNEEESIFRFRGALPYHIKQRFLEEFRPDIIILPQTGNASPQLTLVRCENASEEALFIAREICKLTHHGYHFRDIVVLCRGVSREIRNLEDALSIHGINYAVMGGIAFFKQPEIVQVMSILKTISGEEEGADSNLLRALSAPEFMIDPVSLQRIFAYSQRRGLPLWDMLKELLSEKRSCFSGAEDLGMPYPGEELKEGTISSLRRFFVLVQELREDAKRESLERFIYKVLLRFGYLKLGTRNRRVAQNLSYFLEIVKKFQRIENNLAFSDFMDYLSEMVQSYGRDEAIAFVPQLDSVRIMTVQKASGKFFPVVFVSGLVEGKLPRDLPESSLLTSSERRNLGLEPVPELREHLQEERRIFDVAISRAREKLYLTYAKTYELRKESTLSLFVLDFLGAEKEEDLKEKCNTAGIKFIDKPTILEGERESEILTKEDLIVSWLTTQDRDLEFLVREIEGDKYKHIERVAQEFTQELLWDRVNIPVDYPFSSYKLESFVECPAKFFFLSILKIWIEPRPAMIFGRILHKILATYHRKYDRKDLLLRKEATSDLETEIQKAFSEVGNGFSSNFEREVYQALCRQILFRYLEKERERDNFAIAEIEKEVAWQVDGLNFSGRIDRLDTEEDGTEEVIDYKTSKSAFMEFTLCRKMNSGETFQLPIYFFGVREGLQRPVQRVSIYWLRKDLKNLRANIKATVELDRDYSSGTVSISGEEALKNALAHLKKKAREILQGYYPQKSKNCWNCDFRFLCDRKVSED